VVEIRSAERRALCRALSNSISRLAQQLGQPGGTAIRTNGDQLAG